MRLQTRKQSFSFNGGLIFNFVTKFISFKPKASEKGENILKCVGKMKNYILCIISFHVAIIRGVE